MPSPISDSEPASPSLVHGGSVLNAKPIGETAAAEPPAGNASPTGSHSRVNLKLKPMGVPEPKPVEVTHASDPTVSTSVPPAQASEEDDSSSKIVPPPVTKSRIGILRPGQRTENKIPVDPSSQTVSESAEEKKNETAAADADEGASSKVFAPPKEKSQIGILRPGERTGAKIEVPKEEEMPKEEEKQKEAPAEKTETAAKEKENGKSSTVPPLFVQKKAAGDDVASSPMYIILSTVSLIVLVLLIALSVIQLSNLFWGTNI